MQMRFYVKQRIFWTRIFAIIAIILLLFSSHSWRSDGIFYFLMEWIGFSMVVIATLGRLWCSLYIAGYKDDQMITLGPYSLVRNPLYFFSFIGALGLGFSSQNLIIIGLMITMFVVFYPHVIDSEEKTLEMLFKDQYIQYKNTTPKYWPSFKNYQEPNEYTVKPKQITIAFLSAMWFLWFFMIFNIIELFQNMNILPVLFCFP